MQHKNSLKVGFYVYNLTNTDMTRDTILTLRAFSALGIKIPDPAVIIYINFQDAAGGRKGKDVLNL